MFKPHELQEYRDERIATVGADRGFGPNLLRRLQEIERRLPKEFDGSLPYYLAVQHHRYGVGLKRFANQYGMGHCSIRMVFEYFRIPKLSEDDMFRSVVYYLWRDPELLREHSKALEERRKNGLPVQSIHEGFKSKPKLGRPPQEWNRHVGSRKRRDRHGLRCACNRMQD